MEIYSTEEERLEALQRWWKENKSSVFGGLLLGLAAICGWKMWRRRRHPRRMRCRFASALLR